MKRTCGYLVKTKHYAIRYKTREPDYSHSQKLNYEWTRTVYGNVKEEIPKDIPEPLGKRVITTTFLDANLLHDIVAGKSVTTKAMKEGWLMNGRWKEGSLMIELLKQTKTRMKI